MDMLRSMRKMVKTANPNNVICANVMSALPAGKNGREFVRRTKVADYGLTESSTQNVTKALKGWIDRTGLQFFFLSHGSYENHKQKVQIAKRLKQPLCLLLPTPFDKADPRVLQLYETG